MGLVAMTANTYDYKGKASIANKLATASNAVAIPILLSALTLFSGYIGNVRDRVVKNPFQGNGFTRKWCYGLYLLFALHFLALSNAIAGIVAYIQKSKNPSPELLNTISIGITVACISLATFVIPKYISSTNGINTISIFQRMRGKHATLSEGYLPINNE